MNIIEMAEQAGFVEYELDDGTTEAFDKRYAKFAALVAAAARADEREACAKVCDDYDVKYEVNPCDTAKGIALEIRARGTT